MTYSNNSES